MKILRLFVIAAIILLFVFLVIFVPRVLIIDEIMCSSQFGPCKQSIVESLANIKQNSLFDASRNIDEYFLDNTLVSDYSVQFKLPRKLTVSVIERKPVFGVKAGQGSQIALIDKDGRVISIEDTSGLPILITNGNLPEIGHIISPRILFALKIVSDMHSVYHVSGGSIENDGLEFDLKDGPLVIFPLEGDVDILLGSLSSILSQLNIGDGDIKIGTTDEVRLIDLRFKNPVIR